MTTFEIILLVVAGIIALFLLFGGLYMAFGWNKWFYDRILGWHKPIDKVVFDGCSYASKCKYCGKPIMQDSQGNWFEI